MNIVQVFDPEVIRQTLGVDWKNYNPEEFGDEIGGPDAPGEEWCKRSFIYLLENGAKLKFHLDSPGVVELLLRQIIPWGTIVLGNVTSMALYPDGRAIIFESRGDVYFSRLSVWKKGGFRIQVNTSIKEYTPFPKEYR